MADSNASMVQNNSSGTAASSWLQPRTEDSDLRRYVSMLGLHRWLILICTLIGIGAAIAYVATTTKEYTAEADLFISPVSSADTATVSLGLITDSGNPTGDVETAARLVTTLEAARAVKASLKI